jgi:hypothetical protein
VLKNSVFHIAEKYHGQKVCFRIAGIGLGKNVSFSMAGMCHGQKVRFSQGILRTNEFQHGWIVLWSKRGFLAWLECVLVKHLVSALLEWVMVKKLVSAWSRQG